MRKLANTDPALRRCWHVVAMSSEVGADPVAVRLLGEGWVVARLGGTVAAFADRCPHRMAPLSAGRIEGDVLRCGYHGWCFDAAGGCREIPAMVPGAPLPPKARLAPAAQVAEADGLVFLAPEPPLTEIPSVPEAFGPDFQLGYLGPLPASVGAGLMIDNFLDLTHFPFVHAATIGTEDETRFELAIERRGLGMTVWTEHLFPNREDPGVALGLRPLIQRRRLTYTYQAPFSVCLRPPGRGHQLRTEDRRGGPGRAGAVQGQAAPARPGRRGPHPGRPGHLGAAPDPGRPDQDGRGCVRSRGRARTGVGRSPRCPR